ncbi:hypothetical protein BGZ73_005778 [Actinomortierella ambigua]|nr:hypothetical protein BGZ73_005778 [Actinomortierella ambigua]
MEPPHHTENVKKGSVHYGQEDVEHDEDSMTESDEDAKEHEQIKEESGPRPLQFQHHTSDHAIQNRLHQQPPPLQPQTHAHAHPQQPQTQLHTPQQETYSASFMSEREFLQLIDDYLLSLSPKKREKALLSNAMYQKILMVLLQPKNTQVSTAQFRFWAKKMFTLSTTPTHHIVCHGGKPVATKECLYDVLVYCHRKSAHGGRDKTSAEVCTN